MAEATFMAPTGVGADTGAAISGIEAGQSMMQRASTIRQSRQMEQLRAQEIAQNTLMAPLNAAKVKAELVKADTDYQGALMTQEFRPQAYSMLDQARKDFDFLNLIPDDRVRARASREWLSRYSQLQNIKELEPEMKAKNHLATTNVLDAMKIATLGSAEARAFEQLTAGMKPEEKDKARRVKLGLEGRASGAAKKGGKLTLEDGRQIDAVLNPATGKYELADIVDDGGESISRPETKTEFVSQSTEDKARAAEQGKKDAEYQAKLRETKPKRQAALRQAEANTERLSSDIDDLISKVTVATAGPGGAVLDAFPGTTARDLKSNLDSVKANIGFQTLQAMREASPTGGALGQVSDVENNLLQSTLGSLQIGQSPKQLIDNLKKVKQRFTENYGITRAAFQNEFGDDSGSPEPVSAGEEKTVGKYKIRVK